MQFADLRFGHLGAARLTLIALIGVAAAVLLARVALERKAGRHQLAVPALVAWARQSWIPAVRHAPLLLFVAGLPLFALALADPYTALTRKDVSYPGRRIALMID